MFFFKTPEKILSNPDPGVAIRDLVSRLGRRSYNELTSAEKKLLLLNMLQSEVLNGTVEQYLTNSSGDFYSETLTALDEVNASTTRSILTEIAGWFEDGKPSPDRGARIRQVEAIKTHNGADHEKIIRRETKRLQASFPEMHARLVEYLRLHADELR